MNQDTGTEVVTSKRRCTRSSLVEPVQFEVKWERLPYLAAVQVLRYLRDVDRISMSQVCRCWNNIYKDPSLWREKYFLLGGQLARRRSKYNICFASTHGSCLHEAVIDCKHLSLEPCKIILKTLETLLVNMKNARLRRFDLINLELDRFWKLPELKEAVYSSLVNLLKTQTQLKKVNMRKCAFDLWSGTKVLKQLGTSVGQELEDLEIMNYFETFHFYYGYNKEPLQQIMTKFSHLRNISVNYCYISENIFRHWAVSLRHKLEFVCIKISGMEPHDHMISDETWRELSASCPKLSVRIILNDLIFDDTVVSFLPPSIPLDHFELTSHWDILQETQFPNTLKHLTDCFQHRLQSLNLELDLMQDSIDEELIYLLERCRQLRSLVVNAYIGFRVASTILDLLNIQDSTPVLRCVQITLSQIIDYDPDSDDVVVLLRQIRTRLDEINGVTNAGSAGRRQRNFRSLGR